LSVKASNVYKQGGNMMNIQSQKSLCPYCKEKITIKLPENYAPEYRQCRLCNRKFIVERLAEGFQVMKTEEAPCCSDPDCREIEMGGSDEQ
jgi:hypothetical protein